MIKKIEDKDLKYVSNDHDIYSVVYKCEENFKVLVRKINEIIDIMLDDYNSNSHR